MPARTGAEYIKGLQDQEREIWLRGERVKDVTTHPASPTGCGPSRRCTTCSTTPRYATR